MEKENKKPVRLMLVDDHQVLIDGIKSLLRKSHNVVVVDEANKGQDALEKLKNIEVDIVITDINMPEMSGIELTKQIKLMYPHIKVLVLSMYHSREIINEIILTEAEGYILKNTGKQELLHAIEKIANNGTHYSNEVVSIMMENVREKKPAKKEILAIDLSTREMEILKLICEEFTSDQIAEKLFISSHTVDTHRKNILKKTNIKTLVGLIKFAISNNLAG